MNSKNLASIFIIFSIFSILCVLFIISSIPSNPVFSIEDEYKFEGLDYRVTIVHDKFDKYKIINYYYEQSFVGSIVAKDNSIVLNKNKINEIFYAENVANIVKNEDLDMKYTQIFNNVYTLENKSKVTQDLLLSTAVISIISGLGESSQLPIMVYSIAIGGQKIKKSIKIQDLVEYLSNILERNYNFDSTKNDLINAISLSRYLENSIDLTYVYNLQKQNEKITIDLGLIDEDVSFKITEETYTNIGHLFIDIGNFLISKSNSGPVSWFSITKNEFQSKGNELVEYGQSWQSEFNDFNKNYDYVKKLNSKFVECTKLAQVQSDDSIQFISKRNKITESKILDVEKNLKTISLFSKLKSMRKWIEIEYYIIQGKYILNNRPLTVEYLLDESNKNIEYMKYNR